MMGRRRKHTLGQGELFQIHTKTAPCVPRLRELVREWASGADRYKGVTPTTKLLLEYWFHTDHLDHRRRPFRYYDCQKESIETIIYLYEIAGAPLQKELLERYAPNVGTQLRLLQHDEFPRYCIKMATGSGKTVVMALAVAWQFSNAMAEASDKYAKTFLIIAPNVIVLERLKTDFAGGKCLKKYPIIPKELELYWSDFSFYVRGDTEKAYSSGALYLTNIQQFYDRPTRKNEDEPEAMADVLPPKPPAELIKMTDFDERILNRGEKCMVINDEAHHTHDEELKWNECIRKLNDDLPHSLIGQLDFTATPRYQKGELFTWTVYDYPLKQAIIDKIVKTPIKGITSEFTEIKSNIASRKYQPYLVAAVERWKEYKDALEKFDKKPILFIMMNLTKEANDVGDWLQKTYPEHFAGDKTLVIHTDKKGEITKKDLEKKRKDARDIDDNRSPINAIVSVLMLREGWDVNNVVVILGLRPYTSKANILPEQTIGRGLRLMFRGDGLSYKERVDVLGNDAFLKFVEELEKTEEMALDTFEVGKDKLKILTIEVQSDKLDKDITLPVLTPLLARKKSIADEIASLDVSTMKMRKPFPIGDDKKKLEIFRYEGYDLITLEKLVDRKYQLPEVQTPEEVISYYAKRIAEDIKLPSMFSVIAPKVRDFLKDILFGEEVDLNEKKYMKSISRNAAQTITIKKFTKTLRPIVVEKKQPSLENEGIKLSDTKAFPFSGKTYKASKCIFNLVPCANDFEKSVATFLEHAKDVQRFSSIPQQIGFSIIYTDSVNNIRHYRPDFVVVDKNNTHFVVETKGREDIDVKFKDEAAERWCIAASQLTGIEWRYVKIMQKEFEASDIKLFSDHALIWKET